MKKWLIAAVLVLPTMAFAQKVGVIDPVAALQNADEVKKRFSSIERDVQKDRRRLESLGKEVRSLRNRLQKEGMTMGEDERVQLQTEGQQKMIEAENLQKKLQKKMNQGQREIMSVMQPKLQTAVENIANKEDLDIVVNAQAVIFAEDGLDITEAVTKQLNKMK